MNAPRPTVAHLVTPYLMLTGSWIHAQLLHNRRYRAIVVAQSIENREIFPFEPIHDLSDDRGATESVAFQMSKYLLGRFPAGPYRRVATREGVRLFHAHLGWEGVRTSHLRRIVGVPHVTSFYGRDATMLARKPYWRRLYRRLFREGDLFLAEGSCMGRTLERIGCPAEKIRVVHLGIDLSGIRFLERRPNPDGTVIGLIAASFREKKGIPYALEAVARVVPRNPSLRLRLIGDGPMRGEIEARIARPDLAGRVDLLGYRGFSSYLEELGAAHFMLAPSVAAADGDTEGGAPVCILEAQASGMPVLATKHCDIPEVTLPGESALLSEERDVDGLAENLEALLRSPEAWPAMGRAGRMLVEAQHDIRVQTERLSEHYDQLLGSD